MNLKKSDMSRIIRFKAKRIDNGEWTEGDLLNGKDNHVFIREQDTSIAFTKLHEIAPSTICQFTGLYAENNVPIYENDIVECTYFNSQGDDTQVRGIVIWQDWGYCLRPIGKDAEKYDKMGYEYLDLPTTEEDTESSIRVLSMKEISKNTNDGTFNKFADSMLSGMKSLDSDISQFVDENFEDLI